jgi:hypothetical protein
MHKFAKFIVQQAAKVFPVLSFLVVNTFCSQTILAQTQESARDLEPSTLTAEEINGLKSQVEKAYRVELANCYQKFAVNSCKDNASQNRINELSKLRLIEIKIEATERNKKAAELEKEAQMKVTERERQQQEKTQRANIEYQNRLKENQEKNLEHHTKPGQLLPHNAEPLLGEPGTPPKGEARARFEDKQREALQHKEEVQRRLKEKAESKTPTQQPHP